MSCDYKINGEATLRRTPEVIDAIEYLRTEILGEDYVEIVSVGTNTLELRLDYDDVNTINTPEHVKDFLESIAPATIGSGAFQITTSGESWTEWIGEPDAIRKDKSGVALDTIEESAAELLPEDIARAIEHLKRRQAELARP